MVARINGALGRTGVMDWVSQRATALIMLVYLAFMVYFFCTHHPLSYAAWHALFAMTFMRVFTILTAFCVALHAWIGVWSILMDYVSCGVLRVILKVLVLLALAFEFIWLIDCLWR